MKILTPVKRVIDPYAKVHPLPDGSGMDTTGIKFDVNPFDEIAVEEAVRLKEADSSISITAISIGTGDAEEQLRKALAMGTDDAILIETADDLDPSVVAAELEAVVRSENPDIVLMGKQATDDDSCQAGQMLAARLDWPQATFAAKVSVGDGYAEVTRETDDGEETLRLPLPCVITTDLRLNEPRYIALPGIIKARSKPLERRSRATNAQPKVKMSSVAPPPERAPGVKVNSVDELVSALRERGVL